MGTSMIDLQRNTFIQAIGSITNNDWKVLVVDEESRTLLYNVTKEDDILNANITNIERIEERRQAQPDTDAIYLLSPLPHIVECLKADLSRKRYRKAYLVWTSALPRHLWEEIFKSETRKQQVADTRNLSIDFFPKESNIVTFREPWSFQVLFNPTCDGLVKGHLDSLTRKIVSVCVSLGEYPLVKFYSPRADHEAKVLCSHLASFVQQALDDYARNPRNEFPPQSTRPRATLIITDRTMDLMSPLVHELTYQAMAMDLLPIQDSNDKMTYRNVIRRGQPDQEEKDVEISENDKIWVENRHLHMKDLLIKLSNDFKKFQAKNPQFAGMDDETVSVNTIKDMLAGLPEFQEGKSAFSLHIDMAEKCAKIFQEAKLMDVTSVEQSLATGLDEDNRKPKNLADQLARLLDDDSVNRENRVRLLIMYILYRDGVLAGDIEKLRCHGELSPMDSEIIYNLISLGAKVRKDLQEIKQPTAPIEPLFPPKIVDYAPGEEVSLSRFEPALKYMLEAHCNGTLDMKTFRPVKPHLSDNSRPPLVQAHQTSLRSGTQPTWAKGRGGNTKPKERIIVFMAGGATYSEARACYEISQQMQKEVYLATTHMLTPKMFLRQVSVMRTDRRQLKLPADRAPPKLPSWMSDAPPQALQSQSGSQGLPNGPNGRQPRAPTDEMQKTSIDPRQGGSAAPVREAIPARPPPMKGIPSASPSPSPVPEKGDGKLKKEKKDKKHLGLFKRH